jgi:N-formylglutamate amidohydrolase
MAETTKDESTTCDAAQPESAQPESAHPEPGPPGSTITPPPFEVLAPDRQSVPLVLSSPHSGRYYSQSFLDQSRLDRRTIRSSEDLMIDALFADAVGLGAPLMRATYPRAFLDVNREPFELDPKMFVGRLPPFANIRSLRVAGGLGTIPRIVCDAQDIYHGPIPVEAALERIEAIYKPYHDQLRRLLARTHVAFGHALLIDCHSMPSAMRAGHGRLRPDFVLGDRFGTSCSGDLTDAAALCLRELGYTVSRNKPYAGGFITEHYGRPSRHLHALQIEINRALYMDEPNLELHDGFERLRSDIACLIDALIRSLHMTYRAAPVTTATAPPIAAE